MLETIVIALLVAAFILTRPLQASILRVRDDIIIADDPTFFWWRRRSFARTEVESYEISIAPWYRRWVTFRFHMKDGTTQEVPIGDAAPWVVRNIERALSGHDD